MTSIEVGSCLTVESFRSTTSSSTRTTFPVVHVSANRRERVKRWHLDKMATINKEQAAEIGIDLEAHDKRELFIWKPIHERFFIRELLLVEPYMHKQGSKERAQAWKLIVENLKSNFSPSFRVSVRSVRDKFPKLIQKMSLLGTLLPTNMAATI